MDIEYPNTTEDEKKRNRWGNNVIYAAVDHQIYPFYEALYGKRKSQEVSSFSHQNLTYLLIRPLAHPYRRGIKQRHEWRRNAESRLYSRFHVLLPIIYSRST